MDLKNLMTSNEVQRLYVPAYIAKLKVIYPDYEIFESIVHPDFITFRKKVGESKFGDKTNAFTVDITADIFVYYAQLYNLL